MSRALIGHTGFVGSHLAAQAEFDHFYNSKNIEDIVGRSFDLLVCSGARAEKWLANAQPQQDRAGIERLMMCLAGVRAGRVVLISTVDVYKASAGADEATPIDIQGLCPYGAHRYELETFVRERFDALVVRLPGLFGDGLKKNVIFDFLHGNQVDRIHSQSSFQFYDLAWLWRDISRAQDACLPLVHLATEPLTVEHLAREVFHVQFTNQTAGGPARYDLRTRYNDVLGGSRGYLRRRTEVLEAMQAFVRRQELIPVCN